MKTNLIARAAAYAVGGIAAAICAGCVVYAQPAYYQPVAYQPAPVPVVAVGGPVIDGGIAIDVEPAPPLRVYCYDPGFPPGCYSYNGYYWYNGYRYPHDVFVNRYVTVNVRQNRYVNVDENRERGRVIEQQHRTEYEHTGGRHVSAPPGSRPEDGRPPEHNPY